MKHHIVILLAFLLTFTGCRQLVEIDPPVGEVVGKDIYATNTTAASVLTGIYTMASQRYGSFTGNGGVTMRTGLSGDELVNTTQPTELMHFLYMNTLTNQGMQLFWPGLYDLISKINSAIEGITASGGITAPVKTQLLGEAKFMRAFAYFHLVNFYGDVPLVLTTDLATNANISRTAVSEVYAQIIEDLKQAQAGLSPDYVSSDAQTPAAERVRPNKAAATALLARVYLYTQQWPLAEAEATKLISNTAVYGLESLSNTFLRTSREAIWQLQPIEMGANTPEAEYFVLEAGENRPAGPDGEPSGRPVYMSAQLAASFEQGDERRHSWIDSVIVSGVTYHYAAKYKAWRPLQPRTEYSVMLRLAEQYLIRAEARAHQNDPLAKDDLDAVRLRAGLGKTTASGKDALLAAIMRERRAELFVEGGHRWFDLKRTGTIDAVMNATAPLKGSSWAPYKALYPIPVEDIQINPGLKGHQNPGYPEQ